MLPPRQRDHGFWMSGPAVTRKETYFKSTSLAWSQPAFFLPPGGFRHLPVSGEHVDIKDPPGLTLTAIFWKGGRRSEVRDGSVSQLPPSSPAADAPYQRRENKRSGTQPCASKVSLAVVSTCSGFTALASTFQDIPVSTGTSLETRRM